MTTPSASGPNLAPRSAGLYLARAASVAVMAAYLAVFVLGLPVRWHELVTVCAAPRCGPLLLTPVDVQALATLGLTLPAYATFQVGVETFIVSVLAALAGLIFARRGHTGLGLLVAMALVGFGASILSETDSALALAYPAWAGTLRAMEAAAALPIALLFFIFPNGRFVPRWSSLLVLPLCAACGVYLVAPGPARAGLAGQLLVLLFFVTLAAGAAAQFYRYRFVSTPLERQQNKWVLLGLAGTAVSVSLWTFFIELFPLPAGQTRVLFSLFGMLVMVLLLASFPASLAIAILRYRLWDIDLLIRRTLVYSALTATLGLVYFGVVVSLQSLVRALTGQEQSQAVIVLSTLTIAALFAAVRRRLQNAIDRRFYQQRYNAQQVLTAFSEELRATTDLDTLGARLVGVVSDNMQPDGVWLWLRETPAEGTAGRARPQRA